VCFAQHGGGYNRWYWDFAPPGLLGGGQATWHADRGWIFVSIDFLGGGLSSSHDPDRLTYGPVTAAHDAAFRYVLSRLADGTLASDFPAVVDPVRLGIGQSRGGSASVVQQARHDSFDGIGVLGYSAIHTRPKPRPGYPQVPIPFISRDLSTDGATIVNRALLERQEAAAAKAGPLLAEGDPHTHAWCFHYDDEDPDMVRRDMSGFPHRHGNLPPWASAERIGVSSLVLTPGNIAAEAASILTPVLVVMGERDVSDDPLREPQAYSYANDVQVYVCPRMGHMHNFASSRELLWARIHSWGQWVAEQRQWTPGKSSARR
jgi:hypothetical protein